MRAPPWWPPDEPFPPVHNRYPDAWRERRRGFFLRFAIFFLLLFLLGCGGFTLFFWLLASLLGAVQLPLNIAFVLRPILLVALVIAIGGLAITLNAFRRAVAPVGDLMDAAGRVADGDYSTRVAERGPREVRDLAHAFNSMAARLEENDITRRNLLADVSHELRTPLTVIQGNLEAMLDGIYPLDAAHLQPVLDETRQLGRLIEDLRTLALAEHGVLELRREPTDLATLINETRASFQAEADAAGVNLTADLSAAENIPNVSVDPSRLREVLDNLVSNALRYTLRGGTVQLRYSMADSTHVRVVVSDTGAGIAPDELPHIFERFSKSRDSGGAGLGLAIAKNLVEAHGGTISAESQLDKGTTISFTLPLTASN